MNKKRNLDEHRFIDLEGMETLIYILESFLLFIVIRESFSFYIKYRQRRERRYRLRERIQIINSNNSITNATIVN